MDYFTRHQQKPVFQQDSFLKLTYDLMASPFPFKHIFGVATEDKPVDNFIKTKTKHLCFPDAGKILIMKEEASWRGLGPHPQRRSIGRFSGEHDWIEVDSTVTVSDYFKTIDMELNYGETEKKFLDSISNPEEFVREVHVIASHSNLGTKHSKHIFKDCGWEGEESICNIEISIHNSKKDSTDRLRIHLPLLQEYTKDWACFNQFINNITSHCGAREDVDLDLVSSNDEIYFFDYNSVFWVGAYIEIIYTPRALFLEP